MEEFFVDYFTTVIEPDEILAEIQLPLPASNTGVEYMKFSTIEAGIKIVSTSVAIAVKSGTDVCDGAKIIMSAVAPIPLVANKAAQMLKDQKLTDDLIAEAANMVASETDPPFVALRLLSGGREERLGRKPKDFPGIMEY